MILEAAIGLIGGLGQKFLANRTMKLQIERDKNQWEHERAMAAHELERMTLESQGQIAVEEMQGIRQIISGEMQTFVASIKDQTEATKGASGRSANIIPWVRPMITFMFILATFMLATFFAITNTAELDIVIADTIASIPKMMTVATLYWFGSRGADKVQGWFTALSSSRAAGGKF